MNTGTLLLQVDMDCEEVERGYRVSYTPTIPGDYFVTVKYNGANVEGSPFKVTAFGGGAAGTEGKRYRYRYFVL